MFANLWLFEVSNMCRDVQDERSVEDNVDLEVRSRQVAQPR